MTTESTTIKVDSNSCSNTIPLSLSVSQSVKLLNLLWHHSDGLLSSRLLGHHSNWLLHLHHRALRLHLHHRVLRLHLLLDHHGALLLLLKLLLLLGDHLLLLGNHLLLLHLGLHSDHLGLVVLIHGLLRVSLLRVRVLPICEHHTLHAGCRCIFTVLHEHGRVVRTCRNHEVLVVLFDFLKVLLHGVFGDVFLRVDDFANVRSPDSKAEGNDEVEESDVDDEPPVEGWDFCTAWIINATPEFHLAEEHASTDEEVEAKEELRDLSEALSHLDRLQEHQHENQAPKAKN